MMMMIMMMLIMMMIRMMNVIKLLMINPFKAASLAADSCLKLRPSPTSLAGRYA